MQLKELCQNYGIAITGGIACGKTTICNILKEKSYLVIDADQLARDVVQPGMLAHQHLKKWLGPNYFDGNEQLIRSKLRDLIQNSSDNRQHLESIIHPQITDHLFKTLQALGYTEKPRLWFYEAALIIEKQKSGDFLETWLVHCSQATQLERLKSRDKIDNASALAMMKTQLPFSKKKEKASRTIDTEQTLKELTNQLTTYIQTIQTA